jgi:hypothetical protein
MSDRPMRVGGAARRAALPPTVLEVGMISPANPFVQPDGTLSPVSFRFLAEMYREVSNLRADVNAILARLTAAGIP